MSRTNATADELGPAPFHRPGAREWRCRPAPATATAFHRTLPGYRPTALTEIPELARDLGVARLFVKDESMRLGLPAFKALGASWAVHQAIVARTGARPPGDLDGLRDLAGTVPGLRLVAATDGNHGRAVARFARLLGLGADIYVPDVVDPRAVEAVRGEDARVVVVADDYDATVRTAAAHAAADPAAELLQDTAWPGYTAVPTAIVDGYATLFREIDDQLGAAGVARADVVAVPVGVGSLAQAAVTHYRGRSPAGTSLVGVEPASAACVLTSLRAGRLTTVTTGRTAMDGLNCGTPSTIAWPYLRDGLDVAVAVSESDAAVAVRDLRAHGIAAGPCGAAALAGVRVLGRRQHPEPSVVVLLSTEGPRGTDG